MRLCAAVIGRGEWKYLAERVAAPTSVTRTMALEFCAKVERKRNHAEDRLREFSSNLGSMIARMTRKEIEHRRAEPQMLTEELDDLRREAEERATRALELAAERDERKHWGGSVRNNLLPRNWRELKFGWRTGADAMAGRLEIAPDESENVLMWDWRMRSIARAPTATP